MSFRSYIRQFLGAILMLFRPSLPWWFAAGSRSIFGVAVCNRSSRSRSSSSSRKQEEKVATIIFFYRFQKSSRSRSSSSRRKQEEKVAKIIFFYGFQKTAAGGKRRKQEEKAAKSTSLFLWVSEVTLGSFRVQFWCFPSFTAMGICCWEWFDFWRHSLPPE